MLSRINALLRIARVKLVDDTGPVQRLQAQDGDLGAYGGASIIDQVIHFLHFGFASSPPIDSEVILAAPTGDRTRSIALGTNHQPSRQRNLQPGDSCLYDVRGQTVTLTASGMEIDCTGLPLTFVNFASCTFNGNVIVTGTVAAANIPA